MMKPERFDPTRYLVAPDVGLDGARAGNAGCDHVTVSGGVRSPGFYGHFGFSHALELQVVNCDVPSTPGSCVRKPYVPGDFQTPPGGTLWVGRYLSPTQKWREIVDGSRSGMRSSQSKMLDRASTRVDLNR